MEITLTEEDVNKINEAGKLTGLEKKEIIKKALIVYLENLKEMRKLENETQAWDELSDEALLNFEKKYG